PVPGAQPLRCQPPAVGRAGRCRPQGRHGRGAVERPDEGLRGSLRPGGKRARHLARGLAARLLQRLPPDAAAEAGSGGRRRHTCRRHTCRHRGAVMQPRREATPAPSRDGGGSDLLPTVLLYDWDNTLVDGWAAITAALNAVFAAYGMPAWTREETRGRARVALRES